MDPVSEEGDTGVDPGEETSPTLLAKRVNADHDAIVVKRAAGVAQALVAATDVEIAGAQHGGSNGGADGRVALRASSLVDGQ